MQPEIFKEKLRTKGVAHVYRQHITDSDVWYFRQKGAGYYEKYDQFKDYLSEKLDIHTNDIAIVGSAKLGFSLSPTKAYRAFQVNSDIDVVIVSQRLFRNSWDAFLELNGKANLRAYKQITSEIFRRFVSLKDPDRSNTFFDEWTRKVDPCKKDLQILFGMPNDINYRIYESWDSVRAYHCQGLEQLRKELGKKE